MRAGSRSGPWALATGALALAVRLLPWRAAFGPGRVAFLVDTDPHYHVLRAWRIVQEFPRVPLLDPGLNFPRGARVLWPPLFDYLIAFPAMLLGGTRADVDRVAAVLSPLLGAATVALVTVIAVRLLGRRAGLLAGVLLALLPAHSMLTIVGRPDQHSAEILLSTWVFAAYLGALRADAAPRRRWGMALLMAFGLAASFWNWQGSALYLAVVAIFVAAWHLVATRVESRRATRALAQGAGLGVAILALSLALAMPRELFLLSAKGVTGFHVLLLAAVAGFGALADAMAARWPEASLGRRLAEVLLAATLPAAAALALAPGGFGTNLSALGASNRWYQTISEFWPLFVGGRWPLRRDLDYVLGAYGLCLFAMPLALPSLLSRWRREERDRAQIAFLIAWGGVLLLLTLGRRRLGEYAAVPMVLWVAAALDDLAARLGHRFPGRPWTRLVAPAVALLLLAPGIPTLTATPPAADRRPDLRAPLEWLRSVPPEPGREAVLSGWYYGHLVQFVAGRPVLTSPFGVDGGDGAMEDAARFFLARDESRAEEVLSARRVGYVLLTHPGSEVHVLSGFGDPPSPEPIAVREDAFDGETREIRSTFWDLVPARLYFGDGAGMGGASSLGGFRLLYEGPPTGRDPMNQQQFKLFGVVSGARVTVRGAGPSAAVDVAVPVLTNQGRRFEWRAHTIAGADGTVTIRVPYATGRNGFVAAGSVRASDGVSSGAAEIGEQTVREGGGAELRLTPAP